LPAGFKAKGKLFVLVDECHRTQSGDLHDAMKEILPDAVFIGFTGTPLLKADKKTTLETFGGYIHTYKFDEAVADGVVLDLRYEAREVDQRLTSQKKIDEWFELKTQGLTDLSKAQLKQRWGTMQKVLSSKSRLDVIAADILMDMEKCDRLKSGRGNAILVAGSIYEACKYFALFDKTDLHGKCAIVTSYTPSVSAVGQTDPPRVETEGFKLTHPERGKKLQIFRIVRRMCGFYVQQNHGGTTRSHSQFNGAGLGDPQDRPRAQCQPKYRPQSRSAFRAA
jgi:type I restriction enzyme R subunit